MFSLTHENVHGSSLLRRGFQLSVNSVRFPVFSVFLCYGKLETSRRRELWEEPQHPEKTHDIRQSVDRLFSGTLVFESVANVCMYFALSALIRRLATLKEAE